MDPKTGGRKGTNTCGTSCTTSAGDQNTNEQQSKGKNPDRDKQGCVMDAQAQGGGSTNVQGKEDGRRERALRKAIQESLISQQGLEWMDGLGSLGSKDLPAFTATYGKSNNRNPHFLFSEIAIAID